MYTVIIPAAGQGKRMGYDHNKVFLTLGGKQVVEHTVAAFERDENCAAIYLAAKADEIETLTTLLKPYTKVKAVIQGGTERQYSIYNVLTAVPPCDIIMVHDAARPFITESTLQRLYEGAKQHQAVIAAVKAKDTIKVVRDNIIDSTPDRDTLWLVQTPQAFSYQLLLDSYELARQDNFLGTDDASLVERAGHSVHIVESDYDNIKITTPEDLIFAEAILRERG